MCCVIGYAIYVNIRPLMNSLSSSKFICYPTVHIYILQNAPGRGYQWSFIIPLLQPSSVPLSPLSPSLSYSSTDGPYAGPECCVTLPVFGDDDGHCWPHRVKKTVPTVIAELTLMSSTSPAVQAELKQLKTAVFEAIQMHLCPVGQKGWYVISSCT